MIVLLLSFLTVFWLACADEKLSPTQFTPSASPGQTPFRVVAPDQDPQETREQPGLVWAKVAAKPLAGETYLLGDVNQDGQVTLADVTKLFDYLLMGISLGLYSYLADIDQDDDIDWTDMSLLGAWVADPSSNPHDIGVAVEARATAALSPSPTAAIFKTDGAWQTFLVTAVGMDSVWVGVNGADTDVVMEIAGGYRAPARNYCGPEANDSPTRARQDGYKLHLAGCFSGHTQVVLRTFEGADLVTYDVEVRAEHESFEQDLPDDEDQPIVPGDRIYFARSGIRWMSLHGGEDERLRGTRGAHGLAIDAQGGKVYYSNTTDNKIQRVNLDGSNIEDLVSGLHDPLAVELNLSADKMYWTDRGTDRIYSANLNGTNVQQVVTGNNHGNAMLVLDPDNDKMYWRNGYGIWRANLDGTEVKKMASIGSQTGHEDLVLHEGVLYTSGSSIWKATISNLEAHRAAMELYDVQYQEWVDGGADGPSPEWPEFSKTVLIDHENHGVEFVYGLAIDPRTDMLYFNSNFVGKVKLDGTGFERVAESGVSFADVEIYIPQD